MTHSYDNASYILLKGYDILMFKPLFKWSVTQSNYYTNVLIVRCWSNVSTDVLLTAIILLVRCFFYRDLLNSLITYDISEEYI